MERKKKERKGKDYHRRLEGSKTPNKIAHFQMISEHGEGVFFSPSYVFGEGLVPTKRTQVENSGFFLQNR